MQDSTVAAGGSSSTPGAGAESGAGSQAGVTFDTAMRLSSDLITLVKLVSSLKHQFPKQHAAIEGSAYPLLFTLDRGPLRVSELAEQVHSDVSTVSRQVSVLVRAGLIAKLRDPEDRRASILALTPLADQTLRRIQRLRGEWFAALLHDWSEAEATSLMVLLERLTTSVLDFREQLHSPDTAAGEMVRRLSDLGGRTLDNDLKEHA